MKKVPKKILRRLKELSLLASGYSSPNPPVACIISDLEGNILSEGYTQKTGFNHAEREAYEKLKNKNIPHIVFVTLEPCSHYGRTPPCLNLILEYKPKKIFIGIKDPNPLVTQINGLSKVNSSQTEIIFSEEIKEISESFLSGFIQKITKKHPEYIFKTAVSKDNYFSTIDKKRINISSKESLQISSFLRSKIDAIVVGPATTRNDSPGLHFKGTENLDNLKYALEIDKDPFFSTIFNGYNKSNFINEENQNLPERYQPFRIFFINSKYFPDKEFFSKQEEILKKYPENYPIFIKLSKLSIESESILQKITNREIIDSTKENPFYILDNLLASLGCNKVILEGGNFLYEFAEDLTSYKILKIHSNNKLKEGITPKLEYKGELIFKATISTDTWNLFKV
ncbi:MAG: hypothetical protein KDK36_02790 [Leptospiraceae bacterium]|nr:hypothetical protein [Leptospiraceae bacterium]